MDCYEFKQNLFNCYKWNVDDADALQTRIFSDSYLPPKATVYQYLFVLSPTLSEGEGAATLNCFDCY
jgi:hypothetical protein